MGAYRVFRRLISSCHPFHHYPRPYLLNRTTHTLRCSLLERKLETLPFFGLNGDHPRRLFHQDPGTVWKHEALQKYLEELSKEHFSISQILNRTTVEAERRRLSRRHVQLSPLVEVFQDIQRAEREAQELESMCDNLDSRNEKQLLELAMEERQRINVMIQALYHKLVKILVPGDKYDGSDAILEVTSGRTTGGDICQQFAKEVFEMYQNYAYYKSWVFEIINYSTAEYGGLHHAAAHISGDGVYRNLKYEAGTHRVQRIPEIGLSSRMQRVHTGTMTVIVLPRPNEIDIKVEQKDLRIDTFKAKGAGGQHVNTTDSAVRIVHLPTGIAVECQQERSQISNKQKALQMLKAKLYSQIVEKETGERQSSRKLQLGARAQSDRIRTYNFTQDRLTDHRISYEVRNLKEFLNGEELLDNLINRLLRFAEQEALLERIENNVNFAEQDC